MAKQVAQRIENGLPTDERQPPIGASTGIGIYPDDGRTACELMEAADRQLYKCRRTENRGLVSPVGKILNSKRAGR